MQRAGEHAVMWRWSDSRGRAVASGVYYYKLDTNEGFRASRRMVMLK